MNLNLKKPIVFFDLETTGTDVVHDRIIEISLLKIHPDGHEENKTHRVNPTIPINPKATEVHGITDKDVANEPTFKELAKMVVTFMEGCYVAGYNSNKFDVPLLAEEFIRADVDFNLKKQQFIDVQVIFHKMEQRTLSAAYKFYCKKELKDAHSAEADTRATYEILRAQIERYENIENDMDSISEFSSHNKNADFAGRIIYDKENCEVFNFGKYKGQRVADVLKKDPGYYGWILKSDFPLYTKKVLTGIKLKEFNQ